ncbi:MBL fold metallo-hydrolase [Paenibacillus vini]|uniref:MBL fold metallo-hydrolase n=1 Tax=Paenibacillus vini TaxID=1476024 RepID=A0ABQ4MFS1_9BACL|nr:MBL fold metallo-hydrolase [Paenibacillus vini]GIP54855.1 MBL fold metallo-hydrolase [Paenibacillus vini]
MEQLVFLGTGDAMGVPRVYCGCAICEEARKGGVNRRYRSLVAVEAERTGENQGNPFPFGEEEGFLIDCGPDWRSAMERREQRFAGQVLVTHAHFDHIGGLPEWADACRWLDRKGQLYAPQEVLDTILRQYPWLDRNLDLHTVDQGVTLAGWSIRGWKVNHGKNGYSYAYRLEKDGFVWAYCSDSIALPPEQRGLLAELDLLVLGTSFYHETAEFSTRSVYDVKEALELLQEIKPKRTIFTHMSHDIDLRRDYGLPEGVEYARTGQTVLLR